MKKYSSRMFASNERLPSKMKAALAKKRVVGQRSTFMLL